MALRVWLPLNGTLENKGVSDDITYAMSSGNSFTSGGKIGNNALKLTKIQQILSTTSCMTGAKEVSYAFWVKVNTAWSTNWLDGIRWTSTDGTSTATERQEFYENCTLVGTWYKGGAIYAGEFTPEVWTHLAATINYNTGEACFYVNGDLKGTTSNVDTTYYCRGDFYIGDNGVDILQNDVRIYDHCLSTKEVKEISQGLILHYKLDGWSGGAGENLYTGSKDFSGTWVNSSGWTTSSEIFNDFVVKQRSATWGGLCQNVPATNGDIFTVSFWGKVESGGTIMSVHRSNLGNVTTGLTLLDGNFSSGNTWVTSSEDGSYWKRYWATVQIVSSDITYLQWRLENSISNKMFYVAGLKLERGSLATPWSPAPQDLGIDTTKITDSSGYGNDGTITSTISTQQDSQRYEVSSYLNKKKISCSDGFLTTDDPIFTVSLWFKLYSNITYTAYADLISFTTESYSSQPFRLELCGSPAGRNLMWFRGPSGSTGGFLVGSYDSGWYTLDEWHHVALVSSGDKHYISYFDGKQTNTFDGSAYTWTPTGGVSIGDTAEGTASMNDFRIYATALSAEDVLDLYHTSANIDNLGGIHGFEFEEKTPNLLNPDLREWSKESNVTCVWNEETKYFDVNTNRDTSNTSRWGIFQNITVKPNTSYLFAVDMMGTGSAMGIAAQDTTTAWPSDRNIAGDTKRYYYILTTTATNTVGRVYLDIKPSINQIAHFKNIYLGEVGEIASIKQNGIFENEDMVEYNENGRITKSGELAGSNFIEK